MPLFQFLRRLPTALLVLALAPVSARAADATGVALAEALRPLERLSTTGVLYDRVLPLARLEQLNGSPDSPPVDRSRWRQAYDELRRASVGGLAVPPLEELDARAHQLQRSGAIPLALLDQRYERLRAEAFADGSVRLEADGLVIRGGSPLVRERAFAASALAPRTWRGAAVEFVLPMELMRTDPGTRPGSIEVDFADGRGFRTISPGEPVRVSYASIGSRVLTARVTRADGSIATSRFPFEVAGLATPTPNDTLPITASVAWQGQFGTGRAFVYLAPGRTRIENPVVVVEGFDLDNSMNWDELYALLNQENLLETLRADGFDAVVLDFTDATEPIQKNGLVVAELIREVQDEIAPQANLAVVGASMGGLCSRYALLWLEANAIPHRVRTWLSFDAPHGGADIPLGLQYWINFFSGQSADAAAFLAILNRPAARQMLIYHYTPTPGTTGQPDPMRALLLSDFAALGGFPAQPRRVGVINGSGAGTNQGFAPQAQVVRWEYTSPLIDITGNIWAVPNAVSDTIFSGRRRILFPTVTQNVIVSNTKPWDGAPGGSRASFAELDAIAAPYGDIVALHPNHCFIPSVSALALDTTDPFFDIDGTPGLLGLTPFHAVHFPAANEPHVFLTAASAAWVRSEIETGVVSVPLRGSSGDAAALRLALGPNPVTSSLGIGFALESPVEVCARLFSVDGREVRALESGLRAAGPQRLEWDTRDGSGSPVPAGVYFIQLTAGSKSAVGRIALVR